MTRSVKTGPRECWLYDQRRAIRTQLATVEAEVLSESFDPLSSRVLDGMQALLDSVQAELSEAEAELGRALRDAK